MTFLRQAEPVRGIALPVLPGIACIVAPNAGAMTYHGTNTYLIDRPEGIYIVDPGPDNRGHVQSVANAVGPRAAGIVLTHAHVDHVGGLPALRLRLGPDVPTYGFAYRSYSDFLPDIALRQDDVVAGFTVLYSPGHAPDHLCFARPDGVVLTGDHIMGWSSTVVSPPSGNMAAYFASLEMMLSRPDKLYLPGHGPVVAEPRAYVAELIARRREREYRILSLISDRPLCIEEIADHLYGNAQPQRLSPARRNVLAHLIKLSDEGKAAPCLPEGHWTATLP